MRNSRTMTAAAFACSGWSIGAFFQEGTVFYIESFIPKSFARKGKNGVETWSFPEKTNFSPE